MNVNMCPLIHVIKTLDIRKKQSICGTKLMRRHKTNEKAGRISLGLLYIYGKRLLYRLNKSCNLVCEKTN